MKALQRSRTTLLNWSGISVKICSWDRYRRTMNLFII
ncbi:hypothetical protein AHF37_12573 [Paragonimus kellicotti]|nr:hypothetical protein AHF37_12573 [Paragonimus kellicotti]